MQGVIFYTVILAFTSGIFLRSFFITSWVSTVWLLLMVIVLLLWWCKNRDQKSAAAVLLIALSIFSFALGIARLAVEPQASAESELTHQIGEQVSLTGVVVREPEVTAKATKIVVQVEDERILVSTDRYAEVAYGDEVFFTGKLKQPESFETEFGRTFNYPGYLAVQGISYIVSFAQIEVLSVDHGSVVLDKLFKIKHQFLQRIETVIPEPEVGLGAGLLLGVKAALGDELEEAFRATGIIHIVVLSGTNIMLIVIFVMYILSLFLAVRPRAMVGVISIVLFALLVGLSATVVRASIMAVLVLLALGIGRQYAIMRALFFAGLVMLMFNPLLLVYDVGFQLSFLATLGLIIVAPQLENWLKDTPAYYKLKEFFIATVATQIMILPLLLYQIGQFSVVAVIVNMLVLPAVPVAMLLTFAAGIFGFISSPLATIIGAFAYFSLKYIILIATWFASLPFSVFIVPAFPFYIVPILYAGLGYILYKIYCRSYIPQVTVPELDLWTIVEEISSTNRLDDKGNKQSSSPVSSSKNKKPPVFFR